MAANYLMALDEGTSSARTLIFDLQGNERGRGRRNFAQYYPEPGWVAHDAAEIWQAQLAASRDALAHTGLAVEQIAAIGITNQRETTVVWHRSTGKAIAHAIVWQDRRTAALCETLRAAGHEPLITEKTGLVLDAYFSATKIAWLLANTPGARAAAEAGELAFGTIDTWLIWQLTEGRVHATDPSNAARTLLYNLYTGDWDPDLLALFDIPASMLPEIRPSDGDFGTTTLFGGEIPIRGVIGDQQAATFGQGCLQPGMAKNTYGTGCFVLMNTGTRAVPSQHRLLTTVAWQLGETRTYALEGAIFSAGASLQWLEQLGVLASGAEADELAATVADTGDVFIVPAFAGLGAPQWDPHARGTILGLSRGSDRRHLARAALEGMAYQSDEVLQLMTQDAGIELHTLRVDGGAANSNLLMQFQADISGVNIERPVQTESTAWGAAALAGLGVGLYQTPEQIASLHRPDRRFEPAFDPHKRTRLRLRWQQAVHRALDWAE
jgi:glycerol kinase